MPGRLLRRASTARYRFVVNRLIWLGPGVVAVRVVTFALMHLAPGSPWDRAALDNGNLKFSDAALRNLNATYSLDQPVWRQVLRYLGNAARFDFGDSYQYQGQHVRDLIASRLPHTSSSARWRSS